MDVQDKIAARRKERAELEIAALEKERITKKDLSASTVQKIDPRSKATVVFISFLGTAFIIFGLAVMFNHTEDTPEQIFTNGIVTVLAGAAINFIGLLLWVSEYRKEKAALITETDDL